MIFLFDLSTPSDSYTLSLHDALPISAVRTFLGPRSRPADMRRRRTTARQHAHPLDASQTRAALFPSGREKHHSRSPCAQRDRKSTRLNSSHLGISYAVFCLKKKKHLI